MRLATWNVNSLRVRQPRVEAWLAEVQPDVVCLQETKLADDQFPALAFEGLGYTTAHHGQGQWNGVALLSRVGITDVVAGFADGGPPDPDARLISATCGGLRLSTVYVPNGRALDHEHYRYKLDWLDRLKHHIATTVSPHQPVVVAGDFNIAPADPDVYDPAKFVGATHTSPAERGRARRTGGLGAAGRVPAALRQAVLLLVVGLPGGRLPPGPRHAHRPGARLRAGGRCLALVCDRPQRPQGSAAVGPCPGRRRPRLAGAVRD